MPSKLLRFFPKNPAESCQVSKLAWNIAAFGSKPAVTLKNNRHLKAYLLSEELWRLLPGKIRAPMVPGMSLWSLDDWLDQKVDLNGHLAVSPGRAIRIACRHAAIYLLPPQAYTALRQRLAA